MLYVFSRWRSNCPLRRAAICVAVLAAQGVPACSASAVGPRVSSIYPATGSAVGGQRVIINGSGFVGSGGACASGYEIWFGTDLVHGYGITTTSYRVLSDSQISVVTPANFGGTVDARVHNGCGTSSPVAGDRFTYRYPSGQCQSGTCSLAVGASRGPALGHVGLGFLDGFNTDAGVRITPKDEQLVAALHPRWWRLGQAWLNAPSGGVFGLARRVGAQISLDLTSDWSDWAWNSDHAYYAAPYRDLSTYYSFIYNDVKRRIAANQVPEYFDVWNEPKTTGTVNQWLSVYGTAYRAIKAADPSAQVVGPSIDTFLVSSADQPNTPGYELSLTDFLNWEMRSGARFAAITWHEDGTTVGAAPGPLGVGLPSTPIPGGHRDFWSPSAIATHITQAKSLLAGYPALSATKIFVNEYGPTYGVNIPGWLVGDFAALEQGGADEGMMTCPTGTACNQLLDGLIGLDGAPQMPYWVMKAYSEMTGPRLPVSSSGSNFFALAAAAAPGTTEALIGRADNCFGGQQCPQFQAPTASRARLAIALSIPGAARVVNVTVLPFLNRATSTAGQNDVATAPESTTTRVAVTNGVARVLIPAVRNGDAFYVTAVRVKALTIAKRCSRTAAHRASRRRRLGCRSRS